MIPAFLITLREGLEAALIVGIVAAYLVKIGRRDALPRVWLGVIAAVVVSIVAGVLILLTIERLPLVVQETIEGLAAIFAVVVLTWMLFWMRRQGRAMKGDLERGVDLAIANGSVWALAGLAFVSVAREGLETVLFMSVLFSASGVGPAPAIGGLLGLALAVGIGWAIFVAGVRIDLRRFFLITGTLLIFVAAGLCAFAVAELSEAGLFENTGAVWDLSGILPETSPLGTALAGMFGYRAAPTPLELVAYFGYLIPVLILFIWGDRRPTTRTKQVDAGA